MTIQAKTKKTSTSSADRPSLRFPGFFGEWEEKKLGEVTKFWNGKAHEQDISKDGNYIVVNSKFISQNGKVKKYSNRQASPLKKDDIAIVMSDIPGGKAIGKCFLVDADEAYTLNQRIGGVKSKVIKSSFLIRILNRNKYFLKFDNGVSQTNLRKDEVLRSPVVFPSPPEQQKIASFLRAVDEWVENLKVQKESLTK
ncbi:MAG: restriction endonuclease subunit S [Candidatus Moraniibacteriota bacterium]